MKLRVAKRILTVVSNRIANGTPWYRVKMRTYEKAAARVMAADQRGAVFMEKPATGSRLISNSWFMRTFGLGQHTCGCQPPD